MLSGTVLIDDELGEDLILGCAGHVGVLLTHAVEKAVREDLLAERRLGEALVIHVIAATLVQESCGLRRLDNVHLGEEVELRLHVGDLVLRETREGDDEVDLREAHLHRVCVEDHPVIVVLPVGGDKTEADTLIESSVRARATALVQLLHVRERNALVLLRLQHDLLFSLHAQRLVAKAGDGRVKFRGIVELDILVTPVPAHEGDAGRGTR